MKQKINTSILTLISLIIVLATLIHGSLSDTSIFHGFILHPILLLVGLSLLALIKGQRSHD